MLYLVDPIDEYAFQHMADFDGHKLQALTKEGLKFSDEDEETAKKRTKVKMSVHYMRVFYVFVFGSVDGYIVAFFTSPCVTLYVFRCIVCPILINADFCFNVLMSRPRFFVYSCLFTRIIAIIVVSLSDYYIVGTFIHFIIVIILFVHRPTRTLSNH